MRNAEVGAGTQVRRFAAVAVLLVTIGACAPREAPVVTAPAVPRFPEFVFPAAQIADARIMQDHQSAWYLLQGGDTGAAERRFTAVLRRDPAFHPAHAGLGYAALSRKEYDEALAHFDLALQQSSGYAPALAGKGQAYLAMDRRQEALAAFEAAVAADPSLTAIRSAADVLRFQGLQGSITKARQAAQAGRLDEARTAYANAVAASPDSPFLHRELALVEQRAGRLPEALAQIQRAIELDPNDPRNFVVQGDVLEAMGHWERAANALTSAAALEPSDTLTERIDALRERALFESMPPEYKVIEQSPAVTRAQLAALLGMRLDALVNRSPRRNSAVITDTRGNWAARWIIPVARAGFMEVYPNYTFQPGATVRRGDLAAAARNVLLAIAAENPRLGGAWRNARRKFPDLQPGHLSYPAAATAVEAGVMEPLEGGAFGLSRPVTGAEAVAAVERLAELAGRR